MAVVRYRGTGTPPSGKRGKKHPYLADERLAKVVNMAIFLERPLLVKGPPGCGKTKLAASIAYELGDLPLYEWYVKSTSRARDGLYTVDMVRRLQDAQLNRPKAQRITPYLRFGPLGQALRTPGESVVLIDEIDKADIDFPNDLLQELEAKRFTIEELDEQDLTDEDREAGFHKTYSGARPVIVITSNDEKELPEAFLRRCVFGWIDFPDPDRLLEIVRVNVPDLHLETLLVQRAIDRVNDLRQIDGVRKKPATSELIDWIRILDRWGVDIAALSQEREYTDLPYWEVLYKHQADLQRVRRAQQEHDTSPVAQ
jgi:MoxR-like ATPase